MAKASLTIDDAKIKVKHIYFSISYRIRRNSYRQTFIEDLEAHIEDSIKCKEWFVGNTYLRYLKIFAEKYSIPYSDLIDNIEFVLRRSAENDDRKKIRFYPKFKKPVEVVINNEVVRLSSIYPRFLVSKNGDVYDVSNGEKKEYKVHIDTTKNSNKSAKRRVVYRPYYESEVEVYGFSRKDKRRIYKSVYVAWEYCPNHNYIINNVVDHINENTLDDRAENLRWTSTSLNIARSSIQSSNFDKNNRDDRYVLVNLTDTKVHKFHSLAYVADFLGMATHSLHNFILPRAFINRKDGKPYVIFDTASISKELTYEELIELGYKEMLKHYGIQFIDKDGKSYFFSSIRKLVEYLREHRDKYTDIHFKSPALLSIAVLTGDLASEMLRNKYGRYGKRTHSMWRAYLKDLGYELTIDTDFKTDKPISRFKGKNLKTGKTISEPQTTTWWANFLGVSKSVVSDRKRGIVRYRKPIGDWLIIPEDEEFEDS